MSIFDILSDFLYPPKCVICGDDAEPKTPLCRKCAGAFMRATLFRCPVCRSAHTDCSCPLGEGDALSDVLHLVQYNQLFDTTGRDIIRYCKRSNFIYLYDFLGEKIASLISARIPAGDDLIITYPPRSVEKLLTEGFDQSRYIAEKAAKSLGVPVFRLIKRRSGKEQKKLSVKQREDNAQTSYIADTANIHNADGKRVIVIDDVITTGSTILRCAELLHSAGATSVYAAAVARTYIYSPKRGKKGKRYRRKRVIKAK